MTIRDKYKFLNKFIKIKTIEILFVCLMFADVMKLL